MTPDPGAARERWLMMKADLRLGLVIVLGLFLLSGCAVGPAEFKVIHATPAPPATPVCAATPEAVPAPEAPTAAAVAGAPEAPLTYEVRPGDSLWRISRRLLGNPLAYPKVAAANRIADPDLIRPGQRLVLDPAWGRGAAPVAVRPEVGPEVRQAVPDRRAKPAPAQAPAAFPCRLNQAFSPGERLTFSVEYFGIAAGFATLSVETSALVQNRPILHLIATARTHPAFEWFFKVRDRIESYFDAQGLFSWRYEKHLREGSYANDSVMIYDQPARKVIKDEGRTVVDAPAWTQDVLSEFYYFRTLNLKIGETVTIPVVADDGKSYELLVTALRKERIKVPAGAFDCIVVQPALKFEGLFQQKGTIQIWLTDDARRVPVLVKSQIVIGTIDIVLRDATVVEK